MPWSALESVDILDTHPVTWRDLTGEHFPAFKTLCLQPSPPFPDVYPCPHNCGCSHKVIPRHDLTGAIATCRCDPPNCPDLVLTIEDITCLKVDRPKLGRAIARALLLQRTTAELPQPHTAQIGSWSADAVPVILTIQTDPTIFESAVAQLAATIAKPFILLAPTGQHLTANCLALLSGPHAAFFPLATILKLQPDGTLQPTRPPAELFAQFTPPAHGARNTQHQPHSAIRTPKFALRKGLGVWHLLFDGGEAIIRHERGVFYVYWLLYHPDETPIHAIDLMAKVPEIYRRQLGLPSITDPATGKSTILESHARLQERSLALDNRQSMRAIYKKQNELQAILDSNDASEPVKAEALRELEQIYDFLHRQHPQTKDAAQRAAIIVRQSIKRLRSHLAGVLDPNGAPNQVLRQFANHITRSILTPSAYDSGRLTYVPDPGGRWEV